jgi:phage head maturation protease
VKRITAIRDVAIVTNPAYEQTSVATREMGDNILKQIDALSEKTREVDEDSEDTKLREAQQAAEREYNHRKRLLQMKNL